MSINKGEKEVDAEKFKAKIFSQNYYQNWAKGKNNEKVRSQKIMDMKSKIKGR